MESICGAKCDECLKFKNKECVGCSTSKGCPFGVKCFIADYIKMGGMDSYNQFKKQLMDEFNQLSIDGMPKVEELYPLNGSFINMEYLLPNGDKKKFLNDSEIYLGNQLECLFHDDEIKKCFGIVCNMNFLLVCEYEEGGSNPELLLYKKR